MNTNAIAVAAATGAPATNQNRVNTVYKSCKALENAAKGVWGTMVETWGPNTVSIAEFEAELREVQRLLLKDGYNAKSLGSWASTFKRYKAAITNQVMVDGVKLEHIPPVYNQALKLASKLPTRGAGGAPTGQRTATNAAEKTAAAQGTEAKAADAGEGTELDTFFANLRDIALQALEMGASQVDILGAVKDAGIAAQEAREEIVGENLITDEPQQQAANG
jgi:hypothetical protein